MSPGQFRRIALGLPEVEERAHMDHPDFRVGGKIFATLGYPDKGWGMVKLSPDEQAALVRAHPAAFRPANGLWGRQGCTLVALEAADVETVHEGLAMAWAARAPRKIIELHRRSGLPSNRIEVARSNGSAPRRGPGKTRSKRPV